MEIIFFIIVVAVLFNIFKGGKKKQKDRYVLVQERQTVVKNHLVKVPARKR